MDTELRMRGFRDGGFIDVKGACLTKGSMGRAIRECSIFVVQLAKRAIESRWMRLELTWALQNEKPIAPLLHDQTSIKDFDAFLEQLYNVLLNESHLHPTLTWENFRGRFPERPIQFHGRIGSPERDDMFRKILARGSPAYAAFLTPLKLPPVQVLVVGHPDYSAGPCNVIALELCRRGFGAIGTNHEWFRCRDVIPEIHEDELTLVVFLTKHCWTDLNVVTRVRRGIARSTPMIFFIEKDRDRKAWCSIDEAIHTSPDDIRPIFEETHIVGFSFDSRSTFLEVMLDYIEDNLRLKSFAAFLSHHKEGAKSEIRLIKDRVQSKLQASKADYTKVFLDVDNALRLDELEGYVKASRVLILLLTKDVLTRPWVLVELASALLWRIPIVTIHVAEYDFGRVRHQLENLSPQCEDILRAMFPTTSFEEIQFLLATAPIGVILSQEYNSMANEETLELFIERLVKRVKGSAYVAPIITRQQWTDTRLERLRSRQLTRSLKMMAAGIGFVSFVSGFLLGELWRTALRPLRSSGRDI